MTRTTAILATLALAMLAGCGRGSERGVGGLSADEAAQLDNAAETLDASPDGLTAPEDLPPETANDDGDASNGDNAS